MFGLDLATSRSRPFHSFESAIPPLSCSQKECAVSTCLRRRRSRIARKRTPPITAANSILIEAEIVALARSDDGSEASGVGAHPGVETGIIGASVPIAAPLLMVTVSTAVGGLPKGTYFGSSKRPSLRRMRPSPVGLSHFVPAPLQYQCFGQGPS